MHVTVNNKLPTKFGLLYCNLQGTTYKLGWQFIVNYYMHPLHVELVGVEHQYHID